MALVPQLASATEDRAAGGQRIDGSVHFDQDKTTYLAKTFATAGNTRTWTWSCWIQRTYFDNSGEFSRIFGQSEVNHIYFYNDGLFWDMGSGSPTLRTTQKFRDNDWFNIVAVFDSTIATSTDRMRLYVNGVRLTLFDSASYPGSNATTSILSDAIHTIGNRTSAQGSAGGALSANMSQVYLVDGQALEPGDFGYTDELTGQWRPKKVNSVPTQINDGTTWSSTVTSSTGSYYTGNTADKLFDGSLSTAVDADTSSGYIEWTPSSVISFASNLQVYHHASSVDFLITHGDDSTTTFSVSSGNTQWHTLITGSSTIKKIRCTPTNNDYVNWRAIKLDGIIMVDSTTVNATTEWYGTNGAYLPLDGQNPVGLDQSGKENDWGSYALGGQIGMDKATGGFPILNTVNGGTQSANGTRGHTGVGVSVYNSKYYLDGQEAATVNFVPGQTITFETSDSTVGGHPFRISGTSNGSHNAFYSVEFDGTGDYLTIPDSTDWDFGTGDFTVECWVMMTGGSGNRELFSRVGSGQFQFSIDGNNYPRLYHDGSNNFTCAKALETNVWTHLAAVRKDAVLTFYIDGLKNISKSFTSGLDASHGFGIAATEAGGQQFTGKISDLRVVKGTAVYTDNFQPPSTSLTNISGTVLLCCNQSTTTGSTVTPDTITASGDPTSSNDNPYDEYQYGVSTGAISEGTAGAATTITIPAHAPSNLYYYCTNHSGMGGTISIGASDRSIADPYAWRIKLALPLTDTLDYSDKLNTTSTKKTISVNGPSHTTYQPKNFYSNSYSWDGSNDDITVSSTDFSPKEGFTVEAWFYQKAADTERILTSGVNSSSGQKSHYQLIVKSDGAVEVNWDTQAGYLVASPAGTVSINKWYHIAMTRDYYGGTITIWLDGKDVASSTSETSFNQDNTEGICIGRESTGSGYWNGYIQDVQFTQACKYFEEFIPPSPHPMILPESPAGVAYSSELTPPSYGVGFKGDDALESYGTTQYAFGTGDFNMEAMIYRTSAPANDRVVCSGVHTAGSRNNFQFLVKSDGALMYSDAGGDYASSAGLIQLNQWYHIAASREGGTLRQFINGELVRTDTSHSYNITEAGGVTIGKEATQSGYWNGAISNVRIMNKALHTRAFAPPTEPLTTTSQSAPEANVMLLACNQPFIRGATKAPSISGINNGTVWSAGKFLKVSDDEPMIFDPSSPISEFFNGRSGGGDSAYPLSNAPFYWLIPDIPCTSTCRILINAGSGAGDMTLQTDTGTVTTASTAGSTQWCSFTLPGSTTKLKKLTIPSGSPTWVDIVSFEVDGVVLTDPLVAPEGNPPPFNLQKVSAFNSAFNKIGAVRGSQGSRYATLHPFTMDTNATFKDGCLRAQVTGPCTIPTSIPMYKGKWYCEIVNTAHGSTHTGIGIVKAEMVDGNRQLDESQHRGGWGIWHISGDGSYRKIGYGASWGSQSTTWEDWGETWGSNGDYDVMGLALDMDNRTLIFYKNGHNMGTAENSLSPILYWGRFIDAANDNGTILPNTSWADGDHGMYFAVGNGQSGATSDFDINLGQRPWVYGPPDGYQAATLAGCYERPTIIRPDKKYFKAVAYTGNGSSTDGNKIETPFEPDLIWIKRRSTTTSHMVYDSVRGFGVNKALIPNHTYEEGDTVGVSEAVHGFLDTVVGNGFTVKAGSSSGVYTNTNDSDYVAWCWKAGGNKGTWNVDGKDVSNYTNAGLNYGDTSVLNGCSINTKAGFSIVKWTQDSGGASKNIAHGLPKAPSFVVMKHINNTSNWYVVHTAIENVGKIMYLNTNSDQDSSSDFGGAWPGTTYTATSTTGVNGRQLIMYSWINVKGVQWFGQFEGNGDSDGVYVPLGFKPAMLWIKRVDSDSSWRIWDNVRDWNNYNPRKEVLYIDEAYGSNTDAGNAIDFLEQGFKIRNGTADINNGGGKYSYMAWAETPAFNLYSSS